MDTLDLTKLAKDLTPNRHRIPYEPNKHLFRKVAFDVFQLSGSPIDSLWNLEDGEDGEQFLVAQYEDDDAQGLESKSQWTALTDKTAENVTLLYRDTPIQRFASSQYGFDSGDVHVFQDTLIEKLSTDKDFLDKFLESQSEEKKAELLRQFPELS